MPVLGLMRTGVSSKKPKRYAMRTLLGLMRDDKKSAHG